MNITDFFVTQTQNLQSNTSIITMQCFEWCQQQQITFVQSEMNDIMAAIGIGLLMIIVAQLHPSYKQLVTKKLQLSEWTFNRVVDDLRLFGTLIIAAMILYHNFTT